MNELSREDELWLQEFMLLYQKDDTLVQKIVKVDANGSPADLQTLIKGYEKLPSILQAIKELPKPKEKELRKLKDNYRDVLVSCIKAGDWAIKLTQDPSRVRFANIVLFTTLASGIMEKVSKRLLSLSKE